VRQEVPGKLVQVQPEEFICDPYVLEFLNLKDFRDCGKMS
jgi:predicted nuclease of restriction endonuclease-like (RecB) superfamily